MADDARSVTTLERAYVESKVIRSSLERLATRLGGAGRQLDEDLAACTERFESYMRSLHQAYEHAERETAA
jgi:hypothetical protein